MSLADLLGPGCSLPGTWPVANGVAAYVTFRGVTIAARGADAAAAQIALRQKVERFLPQLRVMTEIAAVEEVNLVLDQPGQATRRLFSRPLGAERALLELDLGIDGALVFKDPATGTFAVVSRGQDGSAQFVHLGEPVFGESSGGPRPLPVPGRTPPPAEEARLHAGKRARVRPLLRCPRCRGSLVDEDGGLHCGACVRLFPWFDGKPVFSIDPGYDASPRNRLESQNPYGQQVLELIEQHRDGWVLDMGSGSPRQGFYNVVHLELSAYPEVDVVTDGRVLPFADATFDVVLSEAVLEHVRDPDEYMTELVRVLKPGGRVRLDVAFLQPFHAYPDHYFNMTRSGLEVTLSRAGLQVLSLGVGEHQQPWVALGLILAGFVHGTPDAGRREQMLDTTVRTALAQFERHVAGPFAALAPDAVERLAAGFWCLAQKPR
jgi:SAM-dependent methyltransferase